MITGGRILGVTAKHLKDGKIEGLDVGVELMNVKMEKDTLYITYLSKIGYRPGIATIEVEGEVRVEGPEAKKELEEWKKSGKFSNAFATTLVSTINYSAQAIGTLVSFAIGVAAPINTLPLKVVDGGPAKVG